jgi:hypothetical protein
VLRNLREQHQRSPAASSGVPQGWHPHQLRDKPIEADPERDAEIAKHSAVGVIDAIVQQQGGEEPKAN